MSYRADYSHDPEFSKLISRENDVDLATVALEIARDAYPDLTFEPTRNWINARAGEIAGRISDKADDMEGLHALVACLAGEFDVHGDEQCYTDPDSSYLNRVVETGRGIPISLSLLYVSVAGRAGISLSGVCAPAHFLVRYEATAGPVFLDAFADGRILEMDECADWLSEMCGMSTDRIERALEPSPPRAIVIRMLSNLKTLYAKSQNWNALWNVQQRLTALEPGSYDQRRDLAVTAQRSHRSGIAIDLLRSCLRICPDEERDSLNAELEIARTQLPQWN